MKKQIPLDQVEFAMLQELARKNHLKPDLYLKNLIQETYGKSR